MTKNFTDRQTRRIVGRKAAGELPSGCLDLEFTCADSLVQDALNPVGTADTTRATYTQGVLTQITDPRGVPRSYRYDLRGLMVAEIDEAGAVDSAKYDPAGLLTTHRTRLGQSVTSTYDVMDRVTKTVIPGRTLSYFGVSGNVPADSVLVSYDSLGNVLSMANRNAVITRSYYETGHLRSERVVPVENRALADSTGYAYDGAGRLRRVMWQSGDSVVYRYTVAGDLDTMRVFWRTSAAPRSESWRFTWDGLGRRRIIHYPFNQMTVQYSYDRLGTLRRVLSSNPGSDFFSDRFEVEVRQDSVDVLGRPLNQRAQCTGVEGVGWPCGDWLPNTTSNRFNRLGALVIQERISASLRRDTLRYDRSGNQIQRSNGFNGDVTTMIYPALSNRLDTLRTGTTNWTYEYDATGNRLQQTKPFTDLVAWQYDALSRLVGSVSAKPGVGLLPHFNECRWDAAWRLAQPCGNGGQLALMGLNVTRSSLGWFFVHAPGIDEALLLIDRTDNFFVNKRLQAVTDGRGQLIAIADSSGQLLEAYAGSGHDQSSWQGAGLTTQAQTFDPRKWQTNDQWGGIQQFRNRAYDPATGTWIQEDPMGVAGGVNLYRFNNGNPVSFGDPLGLMACPPDCPAGTFLAVGSVLGAAIGAATGGPTGGALGALGGVGLGLPTGPGTIGVGAMGAVVGAGIGTTTGAVIGALVGGAIGAAADFTVMLAKKADIRQVDQALREALGRRPSDTERRRFGDYIHKEKGGGSDFPTFDELVNLAKSLFGVGR